jgi:hypothetical protein
MPKYKEDSLKAAIVSSIESNWCAMSAGEGIVIGVWIGTFAPHCAIARWVGSTEGKVPRLYKVKGENWEESNMQSVKEKEESRRT